MAHYIIFLQFDQTRTIHIMTFYKFNCETCARKNIKSVLKNIADVKFYFVSIGEKMNFLCGTSGVCVMSLVDTIKTILFSFCLFFFTTIQTKQKYQQGKNIFFYFFCMN